MKLTGKARQLDFRGRKIMADLRAMGLHFHAGVLQELLFSNVHLRVTTTALQADVLKLRQQLAALQHFHRQRNKSPASLPAVGKPHDEPFGSAGREDPQLEQAA